MLRVMRVMRWLMVMHDGGKRIGGRIAGQSGGGEILVGRSDGLVEIVMVHRFGVGLMLRVRVRSGRGCGIEWVHVRRVGCLLKRTRLLRFAGSHRVGEFRGQRRVA